jgi:proline dehydrogenase
MNYFRQLALRVARRAASHYVVGPELDDAIAMCRQLASRKIPTTICAWNDDKSPSEMNADRCLSGISAIAAEQFDCYVSLKAADVRFSGFLIERIAASARQNYVRLHFDSMGPEVADKTMSVIKRLSDTGMKIGCTVPGRWRRSAGDAARLADLGVRIRVVKGQWQDPDDPNMDLREGFNRVVDRLLGIPHPVAIATHDPHAARAALERLCKSDTQCELELLFGLRCREVTHIANDLGVPIRVYLPYGYAWLPYALKQVVRNPRTARWLLRDLLTPHDAQTIYALHK